MKIRSTIEDQGQFLRAQADLFATLVAKRFGNEPERGEIVSYVWLIIGFVALAVLVVAAVTAKVTGKINSL